MIQTDAAFTGRRKYENPRLKIKLKTQECELQRTINVINDT